MLSASVHERGCEAGSVASSVGLMCLQVHLGQDLCLELESRERKQEEQRLVVPFYQLSNGGINASLFFRGSF